jgi:hypothetical protein
VQPEANVASGDLGEASVDTRSEYMAEASPEPYENSTTLFPASSSIEVLVHEKVYRSCSIEGVYSAYVANREASPP